MTKIKRVVEFKDKDIIWDFDQELPYLYVGGQERGYRSHTKLDPTPAYSHSKEAIEKHLKALEDKLEKDGLELKHKPNIYILPRELPSRVQGWADQSMSYSKPDGERYEDDEPREWEGNIVMSAKKTPIHPSVTKYLVAHEYGHHASWHAALYWEWYGKEDYHWEIYEEYAKIRKLPKSWKKIPYGPGGWHKNYGEVMANDFRILIAEIDVDWWPHPCDPPNGNEHLLSWWKDMLSAAC